MPHPDNLAKRRPVKLSTPEETRAKQSFKDECDINNIMAKYRRTGLIEAVNRNQPRYADVTGLEFRTAMEMVAEAQQLFEDMPSSVRKRFGNDPAAFLDFVNDPENRAEAVRLGLVKEPPNTLPESPAAAPAAAVAASTPSPAPQAPGSAAG